MYKIWSFISYLINKISQKICIMLKMKYKYMTQPKKMKMNFIHYCSTKHI